MRWVRMDLVSYLLRCDGGENKHTSPPMHVKIITKRVNCGDQKVVKILNTQLPIKYTNLWNYLVWSCQKPYNYVVRLVYPTHIMIKARFRFYYHFLYSKFCIYMHAIVNILFFRITKKNKIVNILERNTKLVDANQRNRIDKGLRKVRLQIKEVREIIRLRRRVFSQSVRTERSKKTDTK